MREVIYWYSLNLYRKIKGKKQWSCRWEEMSNAIEENNSYHKTIFYENSISVSYFS